LKIIFLDIDGVLVIPQSFIDRPKGQREKGHPSCIEALNRITVATGAKIVVSSCWRLGTPGIELRELLASWGVTGKVIGKTPVHKITQSTTEFPRRESEIKEWLDGDRDVDAFVILDDDNDVGYPCEHVRTNFEEGLTLPLADEAIRILLK